MSLTPDDISVLSPAVRSFADGFWDAEALSLPRPCTRSDVQILKGLLAAGRKVVFAAFPCGDPTTRVPIKLVRIQPSNGARETVIHFECMRDERPAKGIADLSTQEIVLGFAGVPF